MKCGYKFIQFFFIYRAETGEEPTVATAAALFQELCYTHREQLVAGILVAGYDKIKGPQVRLFK